MIYKGVDFSEALKQPRKATEKEVRLFRRWVRYLSNSKHSEDPNICKMAAQFALEKQEPRD